MRKLDPNPSETSVMKNLQEIKRRIDATCIKSGRARELVSLLVVTKTIPVEQIAQVVAGGHSYFGENYVKEGGKKLEVLTQGKENTGIVFDLIGHLQRNKVRDAVGVFKRIQSVDRLELAQSISKIAGEKNLVQRVLLQVNISGEESKSGVFPEDAEALLGEMLLLPGIMVEGLMSIGSFFPTDASENIRRREFSLMLNLRDELEKKLGYQLPEISMGMSNDFELAIEEGATIVRVGTAIFGERESSQ